MENIRENLLRARENIKKAAEKSGRRADDVTLVAVTKTVGLDKINELLSLGENELGENKVQEFSEKYGKLDSEPSWHLIGHLQTNKVKHIIGKVKLIQSVDSERIAEEINKRASLDNIVMNVLIEINIAEENTKYGIHPDKTLYFIEHLYPLSNICVRGLMCIAPLTKKPDENRVYFKKMLKLYIDAKKEFAHNTPIDTLSMGMTNDYVEAIEEGATMVRLGAALFGNRTKNEGVLG
ncbi:MAG: YggS family pyridoxal phosphate-dependent enzyme [Defluviitaleaceae bacterium]|nr:YggS family pyridoxal phosphate-dependent enzyme [Defluviitaleaceae bacterium]